MTLRHDGIMEHDIACVRCGHVGHHHRLDDSTNVAPTDPAAMFRCVWPMPDGGPPAECECPDYVQPKTTRLRAFSARRSSDATK